MFNNYVYQSSTSKQFRNHFEEIAKEVKIDFNLNKKSLVVDIGSNDGIFLKPLKDMDVNAIGVEPAKNISKIANAKGLKTLTEYFSQKTVNKIIKEYGKADLVTAFNVFAHSDGLKEILNNTEKILKKDGEFIFEIQYLLRTINDLTFDNIYHEHFNYWCLLSILNFFEGSELKVYKVKEVDTHGGSLRVYTTKNKNKRQHKSINQYIELEKKFKLDKIETYYKFAKDIESIKHNSLKKINSIISENKKIIGYGAPAKATTVLNYFGINSDHFEYIVDDNHLKHNLYVPETGIKIIKSDTINPDDFDFVLVLAWNFFDSIKKQQKKLFNKSIFIKLK
jgi:SAM-dependent methyltransferase